MTDHIKRPELSEFAMAALVVMGLLMAMGFSALELPAGIVLIGGGVMSAIKIGRWALARFGSNGGPPSFA